MAERGTKRKADADASDAASGSPHVFEHDQGDDDELDENDEAHEVQCASLKGQQWPTWKEFDVAFEQYLQETCQPLVRRSSMKVETFLLLPRKKGQPQFIAPPGEAINNCTSLPDSKCNAVLLQACKR